MDAILTIKYDFHCLKIIIVLSFIIVLFSFELSTDYNQILNNLPKVLAARQQFPCVSNF
jgi:hypothetical protein